MESECLFCRIAAGTLEAASLYDDEHFLAFLDHRPLFPGHVLLIPKKHYATLADLPAPLGGPFVERAQLLCRAVEEALRADGTFVAVNNRVSQSVPHLHLHIVPRKFKDGLKGFFWPRRKYASSEEALAVAQSIATIARRLTAHT